MPFEKVIILCHAEGPWHKIIWRLIKIKKQISDNSQKKDGAMAETLQFADSFAEFEEPTLKKKSAAST